MHRHWQHWVHNTKTNKTQHDTETKKTSNTDPTKPRGWTQVLAKGKQPLSLIRPLVGFRILLDSNLYCNTHIYIYIYIYKRLSIQHHSVIAILLAEYIRSNTMYSFKSYVIYCAGGLISDRNCLPFASTWVHPRGFVGSVLLVFLVSVSCCVLFVFVLCTQCCQCLCIVHSWFPLWCWMLRRLYIYIYIYICVLQYKLESSRIRNPTSTNWNSNFY
jgi:hypothetical protein